MDVKEFEYRLYMVRRQLILLALLLAFVGIVYLLSPGKMQSKMPALIPQQHTIADQIRTGKMDRPIFASSTEEKLKASHGFQHLVSYTDAGFEPVELVAKVGETVRFTNNSSNDTWIAADGTGAQIYPRTKSVCGSSDLDSCDPFAPQDFWEFTFSATGDWQVVNNLDKSKGMTVHVQ